MKVYLASPLGFATSTRGFLRELVAALEGAGLTVHDPWGTNRPPDQPRPPLPEDLHERNHEIGGRNAAAIRAADAVVAVLDGVDVDSGTAGEIGYGFALGKRVWGLRTDSRQTGENDAAIVNLQVQYFIEASGGTIARTVDDLLAALRRPHPLPPPRPGEGAGGEASPGGPPA